MITLFGGPTRSEERPLVDSNGLVQFADRLRDRVECAGNARKHFAI
jgi:hypothetical protein